MKIDRISIYLTSFPLKHDYELSFSPVKDFRSIFVRVDSGGRIGWGESTPLPGYTSDRAEDVYKDMENLLPGMIGKQAAEAVDAVSAIGGFSRSAIVTAIEMITDKIPCSGTTKKVPLVYLVGSKTKEAITEEITGAAGKGYSVFKHKVGFDWADDLRRADIILSVLPGNGKIRFDANQGYTFSDATGFVNGLRGSAKVELIEQPLKISEWDNTRKLAELSDIPVMLDESILEEKDILKTVETGSIEYIKLKLFKCGGFEELKRMMSLGLGKGLKVVLGNGVSTALGCLLEAKAWEETSGLELAGEMNGYLKTETGFLDIIKENNGTVEYEDTDIAEHVEGSLIEKYSTNKKDVF